jgi:ankyrin repeat protein
LRTSQSNLIAIALLLFACHAHADDAHLSLVDAAKQADRAAVRTLVTRKTNLDDQQPDGMTALHWAAYHNDHKMAALLIDAGANVTVTNRYGVSPLSIACTAGNEKIVRLLFDAGADPNTTLPGGETVLMTAARTGRVGPVEALLETGADVNAQDSNDQTAIMWAAAEGHAEVVQLLIDAGAEFQTSLESGFTPLLFAVREGKIAVVEKLLAAGADVNEATRPRRNPMGGPGRGVTPLVLAVENGHFELAVRLLDAGADPNAQRSGFTALHTVTWVRKPDSGDETGMPAPEGSGNLTSLELVRQLVEHGADLNLQLRRGGSGAGQLSRKGSTVFLMAADKGDIPLMRLLLELGADPTLPNAENSTPLMAAAGYGTLAPTEEAGTEDEALEAVQILLELGADINAADINATDINATDDNGETAMHGAAYASFPRMVQFLADHGADPAIWNRKNKHGWTPLLIATGYRPGNFKPSPETIDAIRRVLPADEADKAVVPPKPKVGY